MRDREFCQFVHHLENIVAAVGVAVGPVLQIDIDAEVALAGVVNAAANALQMFFRRNAELFAAVFFAALGQQVQGCAAAGANPVHAALVIGEAEHFHALQQVLVARPFGDARQRGLFALGDAGRGDLNAVDFQRMQQRLGDADFLCLREGDALRLLAVAQGYIHEMDAGA